MMEIINRITRLLAWFVIVLIIGIPVLFIIFAVIALLYFLLCWGKMINSLINVVVKTFSIAWKGKK